MRNGILHGQQRAPLLQQRPQHPGLAGAQACPRDEYESGHASCCLDPTPAAPAVNVALRTQSVGTIALGTVVGNAITAVLAHALAAPAQPAPPRKRNYRTGCAFRSLLLSPYVEAWKPNSLTLIRGNYPGRTNKIDDDTAETGSYFVSMPDPYSPTAELSRPLQRALASLLR